MKAAVFLLPPLVLMTILVGAKTGQAQTYQPSNRVPLADSTLGTQVVGSGNDFAISGGVSRGNNTFHSFQDFSVPTNGAANFVNPVGNQSIITRVTGNLFSDINGTINTQGANFLLINPNGLVFGPGTQLNVGRVFAASTANGVDLADGTGRALTFGANGAGDGALLSIDPKVIFNVSRLNLGGGSGEINNFGILRTNNPGQYIGLVGGNVNLNGGKVLSPQGGRVELGGLSAAGSVGVSIQGNNLRLNFPTNAARANVSVANKSAVSTYGSAGGDIAITAKNIDIIGGSIIGSGILSGIGQAGDVKLSATGNITLSDPNSLVANIVGSSGKGGNVVVNADSVIIRDGAAIGTTTDGKGDSGNTTIIAKNNVSVSGRAIILSTVNDVAEGNGGNIGINANSVTVQDGAKIGAITSGKGNGGNIDIRTNNFSANGGSFLTSTARIGNAGNVSIIADGNVSFSKSNIFSVVDNGGIGQGGNISIKAGSLLLNNNSSFYASSQNQGGTGKIDIVSPGIVSLVEGSNLITSIDKTGVGKGGDVNINAGSLLVNNGSILTSTTGQGNAGSTNIVIKDAVSLTSGSTIANNVNKGGIGNSGNISIKASSLLGDSSRISSSTFGQGNAGNIFFGINDTVSFSNFNVFSSVASGGVGQGGNIDITAGSLSFSKATQLLAVVRAASANEPAGRGNAGNITLKVAGLADFDTSVNTLATGLDTGTEVGTEGNAGNITLEAGSISLKDGAGFRSTVAGKGNSGNVIVTATDKISFDNVAGVLSRVESTGIGNAGDIKVSGSDISFRNGAGLTAETLGQGNAGNITVDATNSISLSGEGNNTRSNLIVDRGGIFTRSQSATGIAGDIIINAPNITLDNQGIISSQSNFGGGGNITIGSKNATDLLFLRQGAQIATDAGVTAKQGGDGGNININATLILAVPKENSDISANAAKGRGGNVNINSQGLFGIQQRSELSSSSDITASSSFGQNGTININTPGIDPGKDTSELPATPTDASRQITQTCNSNQLGNKFYVTGRGGHPTTSEDNLSQEVVWLDPRNPRTQSARNLSAQSIKKSSQPTVNWTFDGKGKVTLLAASSEREIYRANVTCPNQTN